MAISHFRLPKTLKHCFHCQKIFAYKNLMDSGENIFSLDGSVLEGGGQIIRNSIAYSALFRKAIQIKSIRAGRENPGLRAQHVKGIELVHEICGNYVDGAEVTSSEFTFHPGALKPCGRTVVCDTKTAGSITLLIQTILPVLLFLPSSETKTFQATTVELKGGTNASNAPQIDFFLKVFLPFAKKWFGMQGVSASIVRRGYYPRGGGHVQLQVNPLLPGESLKAIDLTERGEVTRIRGYIYCAGTLPPFLINDMYKQVLLNLQRNGYGSDRFPTLKADLYMVKETNVFGSGSGLVLWAETDKGCIIAGSALGEKNKKASDVGTEAALHLVQNLNAGGCVDEYLQDQVVILMVLAKGNSRLITGPLTLHTKTAIWVAKEMTGVKIEVEEMEDGRCLIQCEGLGYEQPQI